MAQGVRGVVPLISHRGARGTGITVICGGVTRGRHVNGIAAPVSIVGVGHRRSPIARIMDFLRLPGRVRQGLSAPPYQPPFPPRIMRSPKVCNRITAIGKPLYTDHLLIVCIIVARLFVGALLVRPLIPRRGRILCQPPVHQAGVLGAACTTAAAAYHILPVLCVGGTVESVGARAVGGLRRRGRCGSPVVTHSHHQVLEVTGTPSIVPRVWEGAVLQEGDLPRRRRSNGGAW